MHREPHPASTADARHRAASDRPDFFRPWRPSFGTASGLASIISGLLKCEDPRIVAQDAAIKNIRLLQARKTVLMHRRGELQAQIAKARGAHKKTSSLEAELRAVTTEIMQIG